MHAKLFRYLLLLLTLCFSTHAFSQCEEHWIAGPECGRPAASGLLEAATSWDPDGPGPLQPWLVVAGSGILVQNFMETNSICAWDGSVWHNFDGGMNSEIFSLISFEGALIAGGRFTQAGGVAVRGIARWNGVQWETMDAGISANASISSLCNHNGQLYAAGVMQITGFPGNQYVARWDGSQWVGIANSGTGGVTRLASHNGLLYAGGTFTTIHGLAANRIASWNGTTWSTLGAGLISLNAEVASMCSHNGLLYVGGSFETAGTAAAANVASWNGFIWRAVGAGLPNAGRNVVDSLTVHNGKLYAAVRLIEGPTPSSVMVLDGLNWISAGNVLLTGSRALLFNFSSDLYRVGPSVSNLGMLVTGSVSRLRSDGIWMTIGQGFAGGQSPFMTRALEYRGELVLTGAFRTVSEVISPGITSWNGSRFIGLSSGLAGVTPTTSTNIYGLCIKDDVLYVGGIFNFAGGLPATNVASWNGSNWSALGDGINGLIYDFAIFNNAIVAVGNFTLSGATTVNRVALWNGTAWEPLGSGLDGTGYAAVVHQGQLYVGGNFRNAGTAAANNIARWNGSSWNRMVAGLGTAGETVYALDVFQDQIVAAGRFLQSGTGGTLNNIARWEVGAWMPLGTGISQVAASTYVYDIHVFNGNLFAAGYFGNAGGVSVSNSARWNGLTWSRLDTGTVFNGDTRVLLTDYNREIVVTGSFISMRIGTVSSAVQGWARWSPGASITITGQPADASTCNGGSASFTIAARSFPDAAFQWRRNSVPLSDGQHGLTTISGATTPTLQIAHASEFDSGDYDCVISTECDSLNSSIARLDVCGADFNCDATTDFFDYLDFVQAFSQSLPVADFNNDEAIDFFDYLDFVQAFSIGC